MKKVLGLLTIALCLGTAAMAQGGQRMTPEERKAALIERLKPLNLTQVQTDSTVAIALDQSYMAGMANFREMSQEDRQAAMAKISEARNKRLEKALGADLAKKVAEVAFARGPRPGGGGGQ